MTVRDLCLVEPRLRGDAATRKLVDRYVEFVAARCRPNTVAATRSDLGVFFSVVDKPPVEVSPSDVLEFIAAQRRPRGDGMGFPPFRGGLLIADGASHSPAP